MDNNAKRMKYNEDEEMKRYKEIIKEEEEIRKSEGFINWCNNTIPKHTWFSLMMSLDGSQDQWCLGPDHPQNRVYQYRQYCNKNKIPCGANDSIST